VTLRPAAILAGIFLCLYGALAVTVNFPKAAYGFKSDEATYYMMGLSLVHDGDLEYRKEDLVRVWREFPAGPAGVFLKKGRTVRGGADPDRTRYYYGKSFIYPLFAAPFILLFGTNGFLVLNAIMISLALLCGCLFLRARSGPWPSAILAGAFVMASVVPVYFVQIMPEVFNFSLAMLAYFCWLYKEVAPAERPLRWTQWLFTPRSDVAAGILLGIATFSKPTSALLFVAPVVWWVIRRGKIAAPIAAFALCAGGLFAVNLAITGEWNYQGGDRRSYLFEFPFQNDAMKPDVGAAKSREGVMADVVFNPRTFTSNLARNLEYFFIGRYAGMLGYFFPGLFALLALLAAPRRRPGWQWLVMASALAQGLIFVLMTPYTWSGGGVGNRYFFSGYGVMLFLLPPIESLLVAFAPWAIGSLFVAPMVLNPFVASFRPAENAKSGPLRLLPVELTLLNDLPVNTDPDHFRLWFGDTGQGDPGFLVYFLDDNAYGRDADRSFWTRGRSRSEFIIKTDRPIRRAMFNLSAGPVPLDVTIRLEGRTQHVSMAPNDTQQLTFVMPPGFQYEKEVHQLLWRVSITASEGFTPVFSDPSSIDARYLGVRVRPVLEARPE
jgi:hypothetical protein